MKVITEEVLKKIVPRDESERRLLKFLIVTECQELDTLTVTRLRLMSDAPITDEGMKKVKTILAWNICEQMFIPIWVFADGGAMTEGESFNIKEFEGWIPLPKYEQEKL